MTRLLALPTGLASRTCALLSSLVMLTSAAALAQSTDAATPPAPAQPLVQDDASGCEPIGLTASGEVVFPFRCKDLVERQRAAVTKPADPKPAVVSAVPEKAHETQEKRHETSQQKSAPHPAGAAAKPAVLHPANLAPAAAKPAAQSVDADHLPKIVEAKTADAKTADAKPVAAKTAESKALERKTAETTKGIPQVAGAARERGVGPPGCTLFQSYNAVSATYLGFDGQRHPCRAAVGQVARNQVAGNQAARIQAPHKPSVADIKH